MNGRHSRSGGDRATRVAEQIHQELAQMIAREVKDPRIGMVTLVSVAITPDYAYATVHFTVLPSDEATVERGVGLSRLIDEANATRSADDDARTGE